MSNLNEVSSKLCICQSKFKGPGNEPFDATALAWRSRLNLNAANILRLMRAMRFASSDLPLPEPAQGKLNARNSPSPSWTMPSDTTSPS